MPSQRQFLLIRRLAAFASLCVAIAIAYLSVMPVTQSMGLPIEPLGLLLAVDTIPDVFATTGNVTGDLTATSIVARQSPDARDVDAPGD